MSFFGQSYVKDGRYMAREGEKEREREGTRKKEKEETRKMTID